MAAADDTLNAFDELLTSRLSSVVADIQRFLQIRNDGSGLQKAARFVAERFSSLGCTGVELIPTAGNPVVVGRLDVGAPKTLLVYLMYDTAPVIDESTWLSPPFAAEVVDLPVGRAIVARGALARRGPLLAFLSALDVLRSASIQLPVNIVFVAEGDETAHSPHVAAFYEAHEQLVRDCSATLLPVAGQSHDGTIAVTLGAKGMLGVEITCDGKSWGRGPEEKDLHWADSAWVDSPMWRLVHAVSTLANAEGNGVAIDGFYDDVLPISEEERALLASIPFSAGAARESLGITAFSKDADGQEAKQRELFEPTIVLEGCWGGLPPLARLYRKATARLDFRLVRNQHTAPVLQRLRKHLDDRGFSDLKLQMLYAVSHSTVGRDEAVIRAAMSTYRGMGLDAQLWPLHPRTPPPAAFERPYVMFGAGHGGNDSSTDEYLLLEGVGLCGLEDLIRSYMRFLFAFRDFAPERPPTS